MIPVGNYNCTNSTTPSPPHSNAMIKMLKYNWCACGNTKHCNWCAPNNTTMPLRRQWTLPNICRRCISRAVPLSCNRNSLAPLIKGRKRAAVPQTELALLQAGGERIIMRTIILHTKNTCTRSADVHISRKPSHAFWSSRWAFWAFSSCLLWRSSRVQWERMRPNLHIPRKCEQLRANQVDLFWKFCIFVDLLWTICIFVDYVESSWNGREDTGKVQRLLLREIQILDMFKSDVICHLVITNIGRG